MFLVCAVHGVARVPVQDPNGKGNGTLKWKYVCPFCKSEEAVPADAYAPPVNLVAT